MPCPRPITIARLSGDEFAVLFDAYGNLSSLARVATRLLAKLRVPVTVEGHELVVSASMGVSLLPDNAREISALVSQANMAMQHAKHLGGNNFQFYTDSLQASTLERLQLETSCARPSTSASCRCSTNEIVPGQRQTERRRGVDSLGASAVGTVPPSDFIGLAEESRPDRAVGRIRPAPGLLAGL